MDSIFGSPREQLLSLADPVYDESEYTEEEEDYDVYGGLASLGPNIPEKSAECIGLESLREVELDQFRIQFMGILGRGSFGEVYYGYYKYGPYFRHIAIKKLKVVGGFVNRDALLDEAIIMRKLNHPNVVTLYGVCLGEREHLLISEFMDLGSLEGIIKGDQGQCLTIEEFTTIAQQISFGMCYIHNNGIIHRDLRTANVLVNSAFHVKVADFGIARFVGNTFCHQNYPGSNFPINWTAPEARCSFGSFTQKSDVYSFGCLLFEMITRGQEPPYDIIPDINSRNPMPREEEYVNIMANCVASCDNERPTFQQLEEDLTELLHIQQKRLLFRARQPLLPRRHLSIQIPQPPRRVAFEKMKEDFDLGNKFNINAPNNSGALRLGIRANTMPFR